METFEFSLDRSNGTPFSVTAKSGDILFVLGANGTGKSSLMQRLYSQNSLNSRWIYAHRQNWFTSNTISILPREKKEMEQHLRALNISESARWKVSNPNYLVQSSNLPINNLINSQNARNSLIAEAFERGELEKAKKHSQKYNYVETINEIFIFSNINIKILLTEELEIVAKPKNGVGSEYSVAELSDGERNALLIAADVLTAKEGTLILIDEPERHLHRSIISPLLTNLFSKRRDCTFVISTHEVMLPLDNPESKTLLLRGCTYTGSSVSAWDVDLMPSGTQIDDEIKKDILGARRKILFIEGEETSLDKLLYSLVFPNVSIIAKSSCRDVEHTVDSIRNSEEIVWIKAFGIVDNDRRPESEINQLRNKGVYALPVFSVESIYYHIQIQKFVNQKKSETREGDPNEFLEQAKISAIDAIRKNIKHLSERTAEKVIRQKFLEKLPNKQNITAGSPINVSIDVATYVEYEKNRLEEAINDKDLDKLISQYPVRETQALTLIAQKLGCRDRQDYEGAVRKILMNNDEALDFVKSLFGTLISDMDAV